METRAASERLDGVQPWGYDPTSFMYRTPESIRKKSLQIQYALGETSSKVVLWMQKGSLWRTILVSSVSIVLLLGFAGLGTFILFLLAATLNAVAIGFLASVASVGAFTALFFSILTSIYIGALVMAVFVISTITFFCICASLTAAGWIAFFWVLWQGLTKGIDYLKSFFAVRGTKLPPVTVDSQKYSDQLDEKRKVELGLL